MAAEVSWLLEIQVATSLAIADWDHVCRRSSFDRFESFKLYYSFLEANFAVQEYEDQSELKEQ